MKEPTSSPVASKLPPPDWRNPIHVLAFGFGSGVAPRAPGTVGTALAVLLYLPMARLSWPLYLLLLVLGTLVGIWLCGRTARDLGVHDHGGIVWDEFIGFWITMFLAPPGWQWILYGFLLFRLLDVLKPWPIKWIDTRIKGGLGIMLDDVLAGIMAALCIQATLILTG